MGLGPSFRSSLRGQRGGNDVTAEMTTEHVMRFKTAFYFVTAAILDLHTKSLRLWAGGWCGSSVYGVRIIFGVLWRRPVACEPDVRHGDLVGIEGVGEGALQLLLWDEMEADSELDGEDAWKDLIGDGLVDETVHEHPHPLDGLNG